MAVEMERKRELLILKQLLFASFHVILNCALCLTRPGSIHFIIIIIGLLQQPILQPRLAIFCCIEVVTFDNRKANDCMQYGTLIISNSQQYHCRVPLNTFTRVSIDFPLAKSKAHVSKSFT